MKLTTISNVKSHLIPTSGGYPFPKYKSTGDNSFMFGLIMGIKNSGKSNLMLSILENEPHLLQKQNKVWFISPTVDDKVETFIKKYPDNFIYVDGLDIETWRDTIAKVEASVSEWKEMHKKIALLNRYLNKKTTKTLTPEEMILLEEMNYLQNVDFDKMNLEYVPINTIIIDDSMGSPLISGVSKQSKEFQRFAIRHRHLYTNLFILSQYPKGISKVLRANGNLLCIFPMRDHSIYQAIFPEISGLFKGRLDNLVEVMDVIEKRANHSFLTIYYDKLQYVNINFNERVDFD